MKHPNKRTWTVGRLMQALSVLPSDTPVVIGGGHDHTFNTIAGLRDDTAGDDGTTFFEWFGKEHASEGEEPLRVVVIE